MRLFYILDILLIVVIIISCYFHGVAITTAIVGNIVFSLVGLLGIFLGLAQKHLVITCIGIASASIAAGCLLWLQYLVGGAA